VKTNEAFVNFGFPTPLGPLPFISLQPNNCHKFAKTLQFGYDYNGQPWTKILALVRAIKIENESFSNSPRLFPPL